LLPTGGVARLERHAEEPVQDYKSSRGGALVNVGSRARFCSSSQAIASVLNPLASKAAVSVAQLLDD